jgi:hypothetical protein
MAYFFSCRKFKACLGDLNDAGDDEIDLEQFLALCPISPHLKHSLSDSDFDGDGDLFRG